MTRLLPVWTWPVRGVGSPEHPRLPPLPSAAPRSQFEPQCSFSPVPILGAAPSMPSTGPQRRPNLGPGASDHTVGRGVRLWSSSSASQEPSSQRGPRRGLLPLCALTGVCFTCGDTEPSWLGPWGGLRLIPGVLLYTPCALLWSHALN